MRVINEKEPRAREVLLPYPSAASGFALSRQNPFPRWPLGRQRHGVRVGGGQRTVPFRLGELARHDHQGRGAAWEAAPGHHGAGQPGQLPDLA